MFFTSGTVVVPVSALDAVFIIVGDLNGLVWLSVVGVVSFTEGELVCATFVAIPVFNFSVFDVIAKVVTAVAVVVVAVAVAFVVASFKS